MVLIWSKNHFLCTITINLGIHHTVLYKLSPDFEFCGITENLKIEISLEQSILFSSSKEEIINCKWSTIIRRKKVFLLKLTFKGPKDWKLLKNIYFWNIAHDYSLLQNWLCKKIIFLWYWCKSIYVKKVIRTP